MSTGYKLGKQCFLFHLAVVFSSCRNPLKFTVEDITSVQLYPETDEQVNILNIKRGIVSMLIVPDTKDEEKSFMVSIQASLKTPEQKQNNEDHM